MRKLILAALCLAMLLGSARAAVSARMEDGAALLSLDGQEQVAFGIYADIVPLGNDLFAALDGRHYALMDGSGRLLTTAVYEEIRPAGAHLMAKRESGWGLLTTLGLEASAFVYGQIVPAEAGVYWATRGGSDNLDVGALCILDAEGAETQTRVYVRKLGQAGSVDLLPVLLSGSGRWGYCDAQGRMAIAARYDYADPFVAGRAVVVVNGRYGAIDIRGHALVEADYDFLEVSQEGLMVAVRNREGAWALDSSGREIAFYEGEALFAALVGENYMIADADHLRVYDGQGRLAVEAEPSASVCEGLNGQLILSDGMWGESCVGVVGTQARYQNLYPLGTAGGGAVYACMEAASARFMNNLLSEVQISVDMDTAHYGLVNGAGEQILPCLYEEISWLADDRFLVRTEDEWRMIDAAGKAYWSRPLAADGAQDAP